MYQFSRQMSLLLSEILLKAEIWKFSKLCSKLFPSCDKVFIKYSCRKRWIKRQTNPIMSDAPVVYFHVYININEWTASLRVPSAVFSIWPVCFLRKNTASSPWTLFAAIRFLNLFTTKGVFIPSSLKDADNHSVILCSLWWKPSCVTRYIIKDRLNGILVQLFHFKVFHFKANLCMYTQRGRLFAW